MQDAARLLAKHGRHGDNNLVHVSDRELRGIEQLTGRKFTRNPDTGLPEAFNFGQILGVAAPIVAGIGGTMVGGPMGGAAAAGLTSAAVGKMQGKSTEQALAQGLMSGITSYAGGQIMAGVPEAAAQAGFDAAAQSAAQSGTQAATQVATQPAAEVAGQVAQGGLGAPVSSGDIVGPLQGTQIYGNAANVGPATPSYGQMLSDKVTNFGNSMTDIANNPGAAMSKIGENISNNKFSALMAGAGLYSTASDLMATGPNIPGQTPYDPNRYPERFPTNPRQWNAPPAGYVPGQGPEYRYFAKGGIASLGSEDRGITANIMNEAKAALLNEHPRPSEALDRFRDTFGNDALAVLRDKVTGGRVRGAGGGMDDLVPGTIEGRQKVRLADGEFVVPADVVSGLGDGSTDQGVRKLHEMMTKVRKQRTGKEAQPKAIGGKISL